MSDLHPDAVRRRAAADLAAVDAGPELQGLVHILVKDLGYGLEVLEGQGVQGLTGSDALADQSAHDRSWAMWAR